MDVPPTAEVPAAGRVWVSGRVKALAGDGACAAARAYPEVEPDGDLLDVGDGQVLHRMDVAEVWIESRLDVDPDEFAAASPDPLRRIEFDLIADLARQQHPTLCQRCAAGDRAANTSVSGSVRKRCTFGAIAATTVSVSAVANGSIRST